MINNYSISDLVTRITLTLPTKFNTTDTTTNLYAFWSGICAAIQLNTNYVDELWRQTNLATASGAYVDQYITELSNLGRLSTTATGSVAETDDQYKARFNKMMYVYNSTKNGLQLICFDLIGNNPFNMYNGTKRGAYLNDRYYYNNGSRSTYGTNGTGAYTAYIEFSRKPNRFVFDQMCKRLASIKGYGIQLYLKYPPTTDLIVSFADGTLERDIIV